MENRKKKGTGNQKKGKEIRRKITRIQVKNPNGRFPGN